MPAVVILRQQPIVVMTRVVSRSVAVAFCSAAHVVAVTRNVTHAKRQQNVALLHVTSVNFFNDAAAAATDSAYLVKAR